MFYEFNWLTIVWATVAATLVTLAAINLAIAFQQRGAPARGHVLFAAIAIAAAASGGFEFLLSHARTVDVVSSLLKWVHLPMSGIILFVPWFVLLMFRAGRRWLAIAANAVWLVALGINAISPYSRLYERITDLERISGIGGVEFTLVSGTAHPLRWVGQVAVLLALAFVVDAAVSLWKRGESRRAVVVAGCLATSVAVGLIHSALVTAGVLRTPYFVSVAFLFIVGGMAYELVYDAVRVGKLERQVQVQEAEVAHLSRQSMLREMSGGVAHELSQPLTAILNNAEAALSFLDRESPDLAEVRGALEDIADQDRHATEVARGLSRLLKKGERQSELLPLNGIVEEALELARGDLTRQAIDVNTDLTAESPLIRGDRVLLSLVVLNLLRNSAEAMAEVDPSVRRLSVRTWVRDGEAEVIVSDRGFGIPEPDRDRVFEPFYTTRQDGSGLGLAVSRTLTEMHGGRVWSEAGPDGIGTTMHIVLPTVEGNPT